MPDFYPLMEKNHTLLSSFVILTCQKRNCDTILAKTCHCHYKTRSGQFDPRRIQVLYGNLFAIKVHYLWWQIWMKNCDTILAKHVIAITKQDLINLVVANETCRKSCWQRRYWLHILQPSVKEIRINLFYYFYNQTACDQIALGCDQYLLLLQAPDDQLWPLWTPR